MLQCILNHCAAFPAVQSLTVWQAQNRPCLLHLAGQRVCMLSCAECRKLCQSSSSFNGCFFQIPETKSFLTVWLSMKKETLFNLFLAPDWPTSNMTENRTWFAFSIWKQSLIQTALFACQQWEKKTTLGVESANAFSITSFTNCLIFLLT